MLSKAGTRRFRVLRRLGFRTSTEIDRERYALKALRGDFRRLDAAFPDADPRDRAQAVLEAAQA